MLDKIKELRETTGLGMMACKKAIEETNGDIDKAIEILRKKGAIKAAERSGRESSEGIIVSYVHSNNKIATILEVKCETDFVAKNEDFVAFSRDIAMHIAAMNPKYIDPSEVTEEEIAKEKDIYAEQLKNEGKPENMIEKIMEGKIKKFTEDKSLLKQSFVKDPSMTIEQLISEACNKMGENIQISRFTRYEIGA